jgi:hypothetical protein
LPLIDRYAGTVNTWNALSKKPRELRVPAGHVVYTWPKIHTIRKGLRMNREIPDARALAEVRIGEKNGWIKLNPTAA